MPCPRAVSPTCSIQCAQRYRWRDAPASARNDRTCEVCGNTYHATWKMQRTCSRVCGVALRYPARSIESNSVRVWIRDCSGCRTTFVARSYTDRRCARCADQPVESKPTTGALAVVQCAGCAASFTYTYGRRRRTRCDSCLKAKRRATKKRNQPSRRSRQASPRERAGRNLNRRGRHATRISGAAYEPIKPRLVYVRDNWQCHLCATAIDQTVVWPDLMCASVDHVDPLSAGGSHTYTNVMAAHWRCNALRRDSAIASSL